ncbi:MAG: hypothetical protein KH100_07020 [Dysgonomonas mossii]|uniref:hypothetical protein n=1 Tax=Dysgonomonas mossii TaxID=163665 RepID=UPI001D22C689|nr:hypothetical protein [Dysgonomonas mossii]MBS5796143.1 hypothetical protein [Dysgonomonas mossii]MBS7110937.1 hypothetical protein [Dysgonomonas mossii]
MNYKFAAKITDLDLDSFINEVYRNHIRKEDKNYFDLTEVEYIDNQGLLVLSALFKTFVDSGIIFEVDFYKKGTPTSKIGYRIKKQIIQFWVVWKVWKIAPENEFHKYFRITPAFIKQIIEETKYTPKNYEIYSRHGITPFITLEFIDNYNEIDIQKKIKPIYSLDNVIKELLRKSNCDHPFVSESLSAIITEELYLNFLDHSIKSSFEGFSNNAFMSISFQEKLNELTYTYDEIQRIKEINFKSECLREACSFFFDKRKNCYKNTSFIQFSFLDFGEGIVNTLKEEYKKTNEFKSESDILRYAFEYNSSRHPLNQEKEKLIPRGLFDTLTVTRRYSGLMVIRSNYGKILFDFSDTSNVENAFSSFGVETDFFPGTLISIYIPATEKKTLIDTSIIKPEIKLPIIKTSNTRYLNFRTIIDDLQENKEHLYVKLFERIRNEISINKEPTLTFINFNSSEYADKRLLNKTLYFLLCDYDINYHNNIILINPPIHTILEIENEISFLSCAIKNYKIHPLPILYINDTNNITLSWLGVFNEDDKNLLNNLLLEDYSLAKSDFKDPNNIVGHINYFDKYGNLISIIPNKKVLEKFIISNEKSIENEIFTLLEKYNCIRKDTDSNLYLCNGNYYQKEYIELIHLLNHKDECDLISRYLYNKLISRDIDYSNIIFIGITTASQKIILSMEKQGLITSDNYILLDSVQSFLIELDNHPKLDPKFDYILICDVISTGHLALKVQNQLESIKANLISIGVIVNILDKEYVKTIEFQKIFKGEIISLYTYSISKYEKNDIKAELLKKNIIRINPHTNIPVSLSINETIFNETVMFSSQVSYDHDAKKILINNKFLDTIDSKTINIGFYKFNNMIHPYFFDTNEILKNIGDKLLKEIFEKINKKEFNKDSIQIFYPRRSGICSFDFDKLKNLVLFNHDINETEIERFGTIEGWRFPHNSNHLNNLIKNKLCLILDDGSCSGDSLIQMIDEISFYAVKEIVILCFIGRLHDHKREFFSRLSNIIAVKEIVKLSVFFVSHWHIPTYYLDENPNSEEIRWLIAINEIKNLPNNIKKISTNILKGITPSTNYQDYKYLPKIKTTRIIPKKELLLIREEVGKVIGYRLYKESFNYFDLLFKKYETKTKSEDRYKEIELLCAVFIYEPYLYEKIKAVLPDIILQIEEFVRILIFSNDAIYNSLTYLWHKKDLIHLFFIVFKNDKLINELSIDNFERLLAFTQPEETALNYVLYKLLHYIPISPEQFNEKKYDEEIKELLAKYSGKTKLRRDFIPYSELRKYYNFIMSLPTRKDFISQLRLLNEAYKKIDEPEYHDDKKSLNHSFSLVITTIREIVAGIKKGQSVDQTKISTIVNYGWKQIMLFVTPILSFSSSFKSFISPFPYFEIINQIEDLRSEVGFIEETLLSMHQSFNDISKLEILVKNISNIQVNFGLESLFGNLILAPSYNLKDLISELIDEIKKNQEGVEYDIIPENTDYEIAIPALYANKIIKKELITNLVKYSSQEEYSSIRIEFDYFDTFFQMTITNKIIEMEKESNYSNGEGLKCLRLLSDSDLFNFSYEYENKENSFIQKLKFNIKKHGYI